MVDFLALRFASRASKDVKNMKSLRTEENIRLVIYDHMKQMNTEKCSKFSKEMGDAFTSLCSIEAKATDEITKKRLENLRLSLTSSYYTIVGEKKEDDDDMGL